jgi:hypothetical protein
MGYLLNYKNWRALHEAAIFEAEAAAAAVVTKYISDYGANMEPGASQALSGWSILTRFGWDGTENATTTSDNAEWWNTIKESSQKAEENPDSYRKISGKISAEVREIVFNSANGVNVQVVSQGESYVEGSKAGNAALNASDTTTVSIGAVLAAINSANFNAMFDDGDDISRKLAEFASWKTMYEKQRKGTATKTTVISKVDGDTIDIGLILENEAVPFASGFKAKVAIDGNTCRVQVPIYSVKAVNGRAGAPLPISDTVTTVSVEKTTTTTPVERKLENLGKVFAVNSAAINSDANSMVKTALQSIFNEFSKISKITIKGGASYEGDPAANKTLANNRATAIKTLIQSSWTSLAGEAVTVDPNPIIQPAEDDAKFATNKEEQEKNRKKFRTMYLYIVGDRVDTKSQSTPSINLESAEFKKDQIVILEHILTITFEDNGQEAAKFGAKQERRLSDAKVGESIFIKVNTEEGGVKEVEKKVVRVDNGKVFVTKSATDSTEVEVDPDKFIGYKALKELVKGTVNVAKNVGTGVKNLVKGKDSGEEIE